MLFFQSGCTIFHVTRSVWEFQWHSIPSPTLRDLWWYLIVVLIYEMHEISLCMNLCMKCLFTYFLHFLNDFVCNYWVVRVLYTLITEKAMATHSSTLAWKIPSTEEPGGLQSMGLLRVGQDWATLLSLFLSCIGEGNVTHSCVLAWRIPGAGEPDELPSMGLHRVGRDKRLSSSSSNTLMKAVFY